MATSCSLFLLKPPGVHRIEFKAPPHVPDRRAEGRSKAVPKRGSLTYSSGMLLPFYIRDSDSEKSPKARGHNPKGLDMSND